MIENEDLISLTEATEHYPKVRGKRPHVSAVWRHARVGIKARNGERIKLEHIRFGGRVYTSREALRRFGQRVAEADAQHFDSRSAAEVSIGERPTPPKRREKQVRDAERFLDETGV